MTSVRSAIEQAVALLGSERELARACGVVQNTIWKAKRNEVISVALAKAIHKATAGKVSGSDLRPDVWRSPDHVPLDGTSKGGKRHAENRTRGHHRTQRPKPNG